MLNLVLFGAPGAGKGTQTERLVEKYGFNHISTGEIIREQIRKQTELGNSMRDYIARGEFAPDSLVIEMVTDFIKNQDSDAPGNIFDGFPRTLAQAEAFDKILDNNNMNEALLLSIEVPHDLLRERLLSRGEKTNRSDDASLEVINNRISIYNNVTEPVLSYYKNQDKHISCDGVGSEDEVYARLCEQINRML
ncbi:MAG: adenylate kinase [Rikenellaceae bacterium]